MARIFGAIQLAPELPGGNLCVYFTTAIQSSGVILESRIVQSSLRRANLYRISLSKAKKQIGIEGHFVVPEGTAEIISLSEINSGKLTPHQPQDIGKLKNRWLFSLPAPGGLLYMVLCSFGTLEETEVPNEEEKEEDGPKRVIKFRIEYAPTSNKESES